MIEAADLRIGNWVWFDKDTYIDRPNKIHDNWFQVVYVGETIGLDIGFEATQRFEKNPLWSPEIDRIKPIPLTPEILEACGFKQTQQSFFIKHTIEYVSILITHKLELNYLEEGLYNWMEGNTNVHLRYLHQLQNLYYTLTGEELKVQLPQPA